MDGLEVVLKYVGGGLRVRDVPAHDLTAEDLEMLNEYTSDRFPSGRYKTLKEFLLGTNLFVDVKAIEPERENKIMPGLHENKAVK